MAPNPSSVKRMTAAEEALVAYDWPGNVRELQHTIEHAVVVSQEETIQWADLGFRREDTGSILTRNAEW